MLQAEALFGLKTPPILSRVKLYFILYETRVTLRSVKRCLKLCWKEFIGTSLSPITVVFGTKGGRPRETIILDVIAVKKALDTALAVAEDRNGRLIDKPDLKSAMKYWHSQASRIGLTGAYSPHSLRYAWAQEAIRHYLAQGFSEKEALALMAMDLGHGDGRGRYVAQVYGRREEAD
ncbi:integrase domain-containing protein [Salmonella enterica subsp. houtenae serovar 16:z4,z23:-]